MSVSEALTMRNCRPNFGLFAAIPLLVAFPAWATDEIQVYNADIAEVGQWTIQQHLNYAFEGRTQPEFPGGLVPNRMMR